MSAAFHKAQAARQEAQGRAGREAVLLLQSLVARADKAKKVWKSGGRVDLPAGDWAAVVAASRALR